MLDQATEIDIETDSTSDDAIFCANCGHSLTRARWAISMDGHERVFINPAGRVFRICCFSDAPGVMTAGELTTDHTWFPPYAWKFVMCEACGDHIGWQFVDAAAQDSFFGLMKTALTTAPND